VARIAVIGGGISGLAAAYYLRQLRPELSVDLFEASDRLGGVLETIRDGEYLIERAADNFLRGPSAPWAEQLCEQIGFADQLIPTSQQHRGAHVYWHGRLHSVPAGFQLMAPTRMWPILTSRLLSPWGRLRLCLEPFIREPKAGCDESLAEFAQRRLGREAFERLVQPLVSGIYTAQADRLSVAAALPQMVQLAREHGSLYRAMRSRKRSTGESQQARGARYSLFVAPRGGMSDFVNAVAAQLSNTRVHRSAQVQRLRPSSDSAWHVDVAGTAGTSNMETYAAVIVALPANAAARVLAELPDPSLAGELSEIQYASSAVVSCGFAHAQIRRPLDAFGCVVPAAARRQVIAISYSSRKFPGRAPAGHDLLRVFVGGAVQPDLLDRTDSKLIELVRDELADLLGVEGEPQMCHVVRWQHTMPQYLLGHLDRVARIEQLRQHWPGLYLAGNGLSGVGIPQCVRSGREAAEQVAASVPGEQHVHSLHLKD
jgi:oxygen-dependent protoporphyrinogen oxidase